MDGLFKFKVLQRTLIQFPMQDFMNTLRPDDSISKLAQQSKLQHRIYQFLLPRLAPFNLPEAVRARFELRKWFGESDRRHLSSVAAGFLHDIHRYVPPCVIYAVLMAFFNGWPTDARFQGATNFA